jgi:hypothetical protein
MKEKLHNVPTLYQNTPLGFLSLFIHPKEIILLKLYYSPKEKMMSLWEELWEGISDYDLLPAGCRALMPYVVRKFQLLESQEDWKRVHGLDLTFLSGLSRFVWTKNKVVLNQTLKIAEYVGRSGIELIAIKGTAELLGGQEMGMTRSTADIDLLIRPEDFDLFKEKMAELGFNPIDDAHLNLLEFRSPLPKDQYVFKSDDNKMLEVDVHLMVNQYQVEDTFTALVWQGKVQSSQLKNLFVPSPRESFLIALVNAFRMHNWYAGSYLKYLCDSLTKLDWLCQEGLQDGLKDQNLQSIHLQDWNIQIIRLGQSLSESDGQLFTSFKFNPDSPSFAGLHSHATLSEPTTFKVNQLLTKNLSAEKKKYFLILYNLYHKAWKSRNKQGYFFKIIFYLITDPFIQLSSMIRRRVRSFFAKRNSSSGYKNSKTPISSMNWN